MNKEIEILIKKCLIRDLHILFNDKELEFNINNKENSKVWSIEDILDILSKYENNLK